MSIRLRNPPAATAEPRHAPAEKSRLPQIVARLAQARVAVGDAAGEIDGAGDRGAHALQWRFQRPHALAIAERDHQHA